MIGLDSLPHPKEYGNYGVITLKIFYKGDRLQCPLGSWLTSFPKAHTRFIPTEQKLIHITKDGVYSAPAIVFRKTVKHNIT